MTTIASSALSLAIGFDAASLELQDDPGVLTNEESSAEGTESSTDVEPNARDREETIELFRRMEAGQGDVEAAKERIIQLHESIIDRYVWHHRESGVSKKDLRQEGRVGLLIAMGKFDYRRGYMFSTYADWWVRQRIGRCTQALSRTVRLSYGAMNDGNQLLELKRQIEAESGLKPSVEELATLSGMSVKRTRGILEACEGGMLDLGDQDGDRVVAHGPAEGPPSPEQQVVTKMTARQLMQGLTPPQLRAIELLFGLNGHASGKAMMRKDAAVAMGVSTRRVLQLKDETLERMRKAASAPARPRMEPEWLGNRRFIGATLAQLKPYERALFQLTYLKWVHHKKAAEMLEKTEKEIMADRTRLKRSIAAKYEEFLRDGRSSLR